MQSELGSGTTVTVTLPAVAEEMGPEEPVTASGDAEVTDERTASDTKSDLEKS